MSPSLFLVTGGSGFLGINLCRLLLARGYSVRTLIPLLFRTIEFYSSGRD